ncbi:MAG: hypothetical protein CSB46_06465 [Micrococcales bacterium]|nr:MAG: hypothetical protein CSB46_06465 [Micrococcales bacterium]
MLRYGWRWPSRSSPHMPAPLNRGPHVSPRPASSTRSAALREANGINGARIYAGQTLRIPGGSAPAATQQVAAKQKKPQAARSYRVRAGDTLSHIAARHATTVDALRKANRINGSRVVVGQTLTLPGNPAAKPKTASQRRQAGSSSGRQAAPGTDYRVKQADTLSDIAKAHGISVQQIRAANPKLTSNRIIAGSTIKIPGGSQPSRNEHRVGNTFAGRSYAPEVTRAAQRNKNTLMSRQVPGRDQMRSIIRNAAVAHGVDPKLALAVAYHESGFNMQAVSPANAVGAMQVIPSSVNWASSMAGRKLDALNPQDNATAGVLVLKSVIGATDNEDDAIAAYYQGLSSVRKNGMYADTKKYVANVKALKSRF